MRGRAIIGLGTTALAFALGTGAAAADIFPTPTGDGTEIEAKAVYCADGSQTCVRTGPPSFTTVDVYRYGLGLAFGRPSAVNIVCADQLGNVKRVTVGPTDLLPEFHAGTILGTSGVVNGAETSARAIGVVNLVAHDAVTGDTAIVSGAQITNNTTESQISGGFRIRMTGPNSDGPGSPAPITCSTIGIRPLGPSTPGGNDFESEQNDTDWATTNS